MKVSEVMTRDVQTVSPDQPAQEAASFMLSADAGSIPVTEGDRLIGMITDRDIAVRGIAKGNGPDTPVRELMTDDLVVRPYRRQHRGRREQDEPGSGAPPAGHRRGGAAVRDRQPRRPQPRGRQRLRFGRRSTGVSQPGGRAPPVRLSAPAISLIA